MIFYIEAQPEEIVPFSF